MFFFFFYNRSQRKLQETSQDDNMKMKIWTNLKSKVFLKIINSPSLSLGNFDLFSNALQDSVSLNNVVRWSAIGVTRYRKGELRKEAQKKEM